VFHFTTHYYLLNKEMKNEEVSKFTTNANPRPLEQRGILLLD
jgi:hypothetical protein